MTGLKFTRRSTDKGCGRGGKKANEDADARELAKLYPKHLRILPSGKVIYICSTRRGLRLTRLLNE